MHYRLHLAASAMLALALALVAGHASAQTFTNLLSFTGTGGAYSGAFPEGDLTLSGTTLYGMTFGGGTSGDGNIFRTNTDGGGFQNLLSFSGTAGQYPGFRPQASSLTLSGSILYGITSEGGSAGYGNIFSINTTGSGFQNLLSFSGANGALPNGNLTLSGSTLYGMTLSGGAYADGNIFSINTTGSSFQNLLSFSGTNGYQPNGDNLTLSGSTLYGMTQLGGTNGYGFGSGYGNIFSINTSGTGFQNLLSFNKANGSEPQGTLTLAGSTLYGMTPEGGVYGYGDIFKINTDGSGFQILLSFSGSNGANPFGSLTLSGSTLYGMTSENYSHGNGSIFRINTDGSGFQNLLSFTGTGGAYPGASPYGDLTAASSSTVALGGAVNTTIISGGTGTLGATVTNSATSSTLYGMTFSGGRGGEGNVFSLTVSGANNLNYALAAAIQSGSATLGAITSGTGCLASGASQPCTVSATSTHLGVNAIAFTASDPNSSNLSKTTTATLTVLDHAAAAFAGGGGTLNLDFGTLQAGSGTQGLQFQIENLPAAYRAGLDLDSVLVLSDPGGVFSTDAMPFADLAPGTMSNLFDVFLDTSQEGEFSGQYQFNLSDEQDLSGHAGAQTLTLNVTAEVVPEPSTLVLLAAGALGLLGYAWRKRRRDAGQTG